MNSISASYAQHAELQLTSRPPYRRGIEAAKQFEGSLIASLLQSLEQSFVRFGKEDDGTPGTENYSYMGSQALSASLAANGGFGIADVIAPHLANRGNQ